MEVTCQHCGKAYRVADRFAGKKANCKHCGKLFLLQTPSAPAADEPNIGLQEDEPLIGLMEDEPAPPPPRPAAKPAPKTTAQKPARAVAKSSPTYDPIPDLAPPPPAAPTSSCPACGGPMAADAALCLNCGFNRQLGAITQTQVEAPVIVAAPRPRRDMDERDFRGVRINVAYTDPLAGLLETWIPTLCYWAGMGVLAFFVLLPMILLIWAKPDLNFDQWGKLIGAYFKYLGGLLLAFLSALFVLWFCNIGVGIAGKILKFQLPEGTTRRAFTCLFLTVLATAFMLVVLILGAGVALGPAVHGFNPAHANDERTATLMAYICGTGLLVFVMAVLLCFAFLYLLVLFFYRLKALEALLAAVLFGIFYLLAGFILHYLPLLVELGVEYVKSQF